MFMVINDVLALILYATNIAKNQIVGASTLLIKYSIAHVIQGLPSLATPGPAPCKDWLADTGPCKV